MIQGFSRPLISLVLIFFFFRYDDDDGAFEATFFKLQLGFGAS